MYVDDLLAGCRNIEDAIELLENIREILSKFNIRFCKIISNVPEVMNHFPQSELECLNKEVNLGDSVVHRTLGVAWNVEEDYLFIKSELPSKPFTRRGILSVTNSIYDPLGIVSPITLGGKLIQRKALKRVDPSETCDWDSPLPIEIMKEWQNWLVSHQRY